MDTADWRIQFQPDSRQRIVNKIVDLLKKDQTSSGEEGLIEIKKNAEVVEEKIFSAATSKADYLREIKLKMLTIETKSQNTEPNSMPKNQVDNSNRPQDMVGVKSKNMRPAHEPNQGSDPHEDNPEKRVVSQDDDLPPPPKKRLIDDSIPYLPYGPRRANHVPKHLVPPGPRAADDSMPKFPYGPRPANHVTKHILVPPPRPGSRPDPLSPAPAIPPLGSSTPPDVPPGERATREISKAGRRSNLKAALKLLNEAIDNDCDSAERELRAVKAERDKLARDLRLVEEARRAAAADSEREIKRLRETARSDARRHEADIERLESVVARYRALAEEAAREAMGSRSLVAEYKASEDHTSALVEAFWDGVDYCKARLLERYPDAKLDFGFLDAASGTDVATPQVELVHGDEADKAGER